ncbi:iron-containing alcohol dehydrogenase [Candidatus Bathyarchaeota archaeon]|nr:iron-containing alcohol dehydrogenase [Candidatus Bathyarchaeota archaeon]
MKEAEILLKDWKKGHYVFGCNVLNFVGKFAGEFGKTVLLVGSSSDWALKPMEDIAKSLRENGLSYVKVSGAKPNTPREDVYRIALQIAMHKPDVIVAFGGGSTLDAVKASNILATFKPYEVEKLLSVSWSEACTIDPYFGTGIVSKMKDAAGRDLTPMVAVQAASSSGSHLTKYSNVTDPVAGQKKLIVDEAITPKRAVFDYTVTLTTSKNLTVDGGLDGFSHLWEVFMGASGKPYFEKAKQLVEVGVRLIIRSLKTLKTDQSNLNARVGLGLGTDLGGYAIMIGGTNGPHLGSFSLVDVLTHGRACGILNLYYTLFFSPAIQEQLKTLGLILREEGFIVEDVSKLEGLNLGMTVVRGLTRFLESLKAPISLADAGASEKHIARMLNAAKDPALRMKLLNMPIPLNPEKGDVENYMKPLLEAAFKGRLEEVKMVEAYV